MFLNVVVCSFSLILSLQDDTLQLEQSESALQKEQNAMEKTSPGQDLDATNFPNSTLQREGVD